MICYVGGHYLSFFKKDVSENDENKSEWVILNDTSVLYKSTWQKVANFCVLHSCYPTVLLFEKTNFRTHLS